MNTSFKYNRLDKNNVACLLVDHQSGLTNCVQDFSPDDFKNNVLALADCAKYFNLWRHFRHCALRSDQQLF